MDAKERGITMITKFVLIVWLGYGRSSVLAIDHFDTLAECEAAKAAIYDVTDRDKEYHICKPYSWRE